MKSNKASDTEEKKKKKSKNDDSVRSDIDILILHQLGDLVLDQDGH